MTQTPRKRGWCPTLYRPMQTGDGLLVRIKPPAARLAPAQARALAAAAVRYGNSTIELTQRGNLQVRGLSEPGVAPFAAAMVDAGLAHPDPAQEARRCVIPPPLLGCDPGLATDAAALTARLEHALANDLRCEPLPAKFAVFVDAGGVLGGRPVAASLVAWTDGRTTGLRPGDRADAPVVAGPLPYPGTPDMAFALAPPFAQFDADMLLHAAMLAERLSTSLRVTPWRALLLGRVPAAARVADSAGPAWITDPNDPRLRITACIGAPGCSSGSTRTRTDAAHLALSLRATGSVHVSGCSKGCAHPGPAAHTLVGRDGRYDLVCSGRAGDPPNRTGLALEAVARTLTGIPLPAAGATDGRVRSRHDKDVQQTS